MSIHVIVTRKGGYQPAAYGPFACRADAELWVSFRVDSGCDYVIRDRMIEITDRDMAAVRQDHERHCRKMERIDRLEEWGNCGHHADLVA